MWKWFVAIAVILFLLAGGIFGYRHWERQDQEVGQREFLAALDSGDPAKLTALMDPKLTEQFDPALLELWLQVVQARLGPVTGFQMTAYNESKSDDSTNRVSEAAVRFTRGTGNSRLVYRDGKLLGLGLQSAELGKWLDTLPDTANYEAAGETLIQNFLTNKPKEVFAMMDPATLQRAMPLPQLAKATAALSERGGALQSIALKEKKFEKEGEKGFPTLRLAYEFTCEKAKGIAYITYIFEGWRARLIAFQLQ